MSSRRQQWIEQSVERYFAYCAAEKKTPEYEEVELTQLLDDEVPKNIADSSLQLVKGEPGLPSHFATMGRIDWDVPEALAADAVIFSPDEEGRLCVAIITRAADGHKALPGGFVELPWKGEEYPAQTAQREAEEEIGFVAPVAMSRGSQRLRANTMKLVGYYPGAGRDSRGAIASYAYGGLFFGENGKPIALMAGDDALPGSAQLMPVTEFLSGQHATWADHTKIVRDGLRMLERDLNRSSLSDGERIIVNGWNLRRFAGPDTGPAEPNFEP